MNFKSTSYALLIFTGSICACSPTPGGSNFDDQDTSFADTPDVGQASDVALGQGPGAGTMEGTWLLAHQNSTCVLGDEQVARAYYLIDFSGDDINALTEQRRICAVNLSEVLGLKPIIPQATIDAITFAEVDLASVTGFRVGSAYVSSSEIALWGVELDEPRTDPLPESGDDPRVFDGDYDGNVGVTLQFDGSDCQRFIGQKQIAKYSGNFVAPNKIEGTSATITSVNVYDSTAPLCGVSPRLLPNDRDSRFTMYRVDGIGGALNADADRDGVVSCDEARPLLESAIDVRESEQENCEN